MEGENEMSINGCSPHQAKFAYNYVILGGNKLKAIEYTFNISGIGHVPRNVRGGRGRNPLTEEACMVSLFQNYEYIKLRIYRCIAEA